MSGDGTDYTEMLLDLASRALQAARAAGATQADVMASRSTDFEVKVADREISTLTQSTSKGFGLRVFVDGRMGFCTSSDTSADAVTHSAQRAVAMAKEAAPDPFNSLPPAHPDFLDNEDLELFDPNIPNLKPDTKIAWAHELEEAARQAHPSVQKFRDSGIGTSESYTVLATSLGTQQRVRRTAIQAWCNPIAQRGDELQTEVWWDAKTHLADLESMAAIGKTAGIRAARMLSAKAVKTQKVPVIFEPQMAAGLIGGLLSAIDGDMVFKKASFLTEKLHQRIAAPGLHVYDDPHLVRGLSSSRFDGEGLATSRKAIIKNGVLQTFLYDTHTARKAGVESTANARRSYAGLPHIGAFNLCVAPGTADIAKLIAETERGFLVTRGLGRGVNAVSGEYSRGANGLWIEKGEIVSPVQEVTIAGNFLDMLANIDAIGNDFLQRGSSGAPSLRVAHMTVSGS